MNLINRLQAACHPQNHLGSRQVLGTAGFGEVPAGLFDSYSTRSVSVDIGEVFLGVFTTSLLGYTQQVFRGRRCSFQVSDFCSGNNSPVDEICRVIPKPKENADDSLELHGIVGNSKMKISRKSREKSRKETIL